MDRKKLLRNCIYSILVGGLLTMLCFYFFDRQLITWLAKHHTNTIKFFDYSSKLPEIALLAPISIYVIVIIRFSFNLFSTLDQKALILANAIAITQYLKEILKLFFGRYWPSSWQVLFPSLYNDKLYGFHFFHGGLQYQSYPSGHAATLLATFTTLWLLFPSWRWLYIILVSLGMVGVLGMNYHFISDLIAGSLLGFLVALYAYKLTVAFCGSILETNDF